MEPDLKALYENHYERFISACEEDSELEDLIVEHFYTDNDHWVMKECGRYPDGAYERAFDSLYNWDAETLYYDPKTCVQCYAHRRVEA